MWGAGEHLRISDIENNELTRNVPIGGKRIGEACSNGGKSHVFVGVTAIVDTGNSSMDGFDLVQIKKVPAVHSQHDPAASRHLGQDSTLGLSREARFIDGQNGMPCALQQRHQPCVLCLFVNKQSQAQGEYLAPSATAFLFRFRLRAAIGFPRSIGCIRGQLQPKDLGFERLPPQ